MSVTNKTLLQWILDCGSDDLSMLEDIEYDLFPFIRRCIEDNQAVTLHKLVNESFEQGRKQLCEEFKEMSENGEILEQMERYRKAIANGSTCLSGYDTSIITEDDIKAHKNLLENGCIDPESDMSWYINGLDTSVFLKHLDFYHLWMPYAIDSIENSMGWEFQEG